jgi:hypothetical protein
MDCTWAADFVLLLFFLGWVLFFLFKVLRRGDRRIFEVYWVLVFLWSITGVIDIVVIRFEGNVIDDLLPSSA